MCEDKKYIKLLKDITGLMQYEHTEVKTYPEERRAMIVTKTN